MDRHAPSIRKRAVRAAKVRQPKAAVRQVANQKAIQVRRNALQGEMLERQIGRALHRNLRFNVEAQQVHGARRPDLSIHDNDGLRRAFVEVKSGRKASGSDLRQTVAAVKLTRRMAASKELHIVARNGKEFFTKAQQPRIQQAAGKDVKVRYWTTRQLRQLAAELKRTVNSPAPRTSQQPAASRSGKPLMPTGSGPIKPANPRPAVSASGKRLMPAASGAATPANPRPAVSPSGKPLMPSPSPASSPSSTATPPVPPILRIR